MKRHKNILLRIQHVQELAAQHYEPGNQSKCYKQVWRHHVYPVYPMSYRTFLNYINEQIEPERPADDPRQLKLF